MDSPSVMAMYIASQPLLWEGDEFIETVSSLVNEYQQKSGDRFFTGYLDGKTHGRGLGLVATMVLCKGHSFFNTKERTQEIKSIQESGVKSTMVLCKWFSLVATMVLCKGQSFFNSKERTQGIKSIQESGVSDWDKQHQKILREWTRQVRRVVDDYLDTGEKQEKKQIRSLRPKSEWRELEANTLKNMVGSFGPQMEQDDERVFNREELFLSLRKKEDRKICLQRLQSAPVLNAAPTEAPLRRTESGPSVVFSNHVETIEPTTGVTEAAVEQELHPGDGRLQYW